MRKLAFEISDNSIQASSSYAGPSVFILYIYTFQRESTSLGRCQLPLFVSITVDVLFS